MWYEKLWCAGIIWALTYGALNLPGPVAWFDTGRFHPRDHGGSEARASLCMRDYRLTGNMYTITDINSIKEVD